ncbi:hypothetical protein Hdeb2414_s0685g00935391 [Helianthus debilis subsp. tardiflorus]
MARKGFMDCVEEIKEKITVTVVDVMNTLSDTVNPNGTPGLSMEQTAVGATLMGLAIMVISVHLVIQIPRSICRGRCLVNNTISRMHHVNDPLTSSAEDIST